MMRDTEIDQSNGICGW